MPRIRRHEPEAKWGRIQARRMRVVAAGLALALFGCGVDKAKFIAPQVELVLSGTELAVLEGEQVTFTVALSAQPTAPVLVAVRSSDEAKVAGAPVELEFSPDTFDVPQTVTLAGLVDRDFNNETATITVAAEALEPATLKVSVIECPTLAAQDFWLMFNPNNETSGRRDVHVAGAAGTMVTIAGAPAAPIPAAGILTVDTGLTRIPAPNVVESGKAFQVTASAPVHVFANNYVTSSVDAFTAVPQQLLGTDYRALGFSTSRQSQISVVATEDNTTVTIGTGAAIKLNRGQSYLRTAAVDVTGVRVVSDKPVGVNTGDACISTGAGACDHVEEMLFPVSSWASDFFVPVIPQSQTFRVVAASDGTVVSVDGAGVGLNAGQFYEGSGGGKRVQASMPVEVYIIGMGEVTGNGDPAFILIPGVQNAVAEATFSALAANNENTLVVSMPTAELATLRLDGAAVTPAPTWTAYASGGYSHTRIPVTAGIHKLTASKPFIPIVWGERNFEGYGYVAGYGYPRAACQLP
ncbi:MAG: IgGFc-binding protein [Myxococcales bacterium]|nr:IgGFc-binding protein [Myxococcales bacterium]